MTDVTTGCGSFQKRKDAHSVVIVNGGEAGVRDLTGAEGFVAVDGNSCGACGAAAPDGGTAAAGGS
ncbi:MAG: hypothetical protein ABSE44_20310 [Candidatus Sulfotelmatobacter sp.]